LTIIDSASTSTANAIAQGNGGNVLIWGNVLGAYGSFNANGGRDGGNGGLIETSGNLVDTQGLVVSATSMGGIAGSWLMDPYDVTISTPPVSGTPFSASGTSYTYTPGETSTILASSINTALNAGTSVSITTGSSTANTIYVNSAINGTNANAYLTLTGGTINIAANITTVGAQTYNGNVVIANNASLSATGITGSTLYAYSSSLQTYTVPVGVTAVRIQLVGGLGGYGGLDGHLGNQSGASGDYTFTLFSNRW
jgi:hypothetical protein